jgi:DNA-directed RNA polymerase specialized sigma24 family protein
MDKHERNLNFVYVWTVARLLAAGHAKGATQDKVASDVTEEVMDRLKRGKWHPEKTSLLSYTIMVGRDVAAKTTSRDARDPLAAPIGLSQKHLEDTMGSVASIDKDLKREMVTAEEKKVRELIYKLPNDNWIRAMLFTYDQDLSRKEVGDKLNISEAAATKIVQRARQRLKEMYVATFE